MGRKYGVIFFFVVVAFLISCSESNSSNNGVGRTKNVILMISDGQNMDVKTFIRWYLGGEKIVRDEFVSGLIRTHNADTPIGDSAPTATAMATGYKTRAGYIGVLPERDKVILDHATLGDFEELQPIASILEAARLRGMATGIISTVETINATPAAFTTHDVNRRDYEDLAEQQLYQGVDLLFGGGYSYFSSDYREDKQDLIKEFENEGYQVVRTKAEMDDLDPSKVGRVWGPFADKDMAYDIDRKHTEEPSLAEMSKKAIEILSRDKDGFFLMVEGGKIDWAGHNNDPVGYVFDSIAFEDAARVASDFAKKDNDTLFISLSDHSTSGFKIGNYDISSGYYDVPLDRFINPVAQAKNSSIYVARLILAGADVEVVMRDNYGIDDLTKKEIVAIRKLDSRILDSKSAQVFVADLVKNGDDLKATQSIIGHLLAKRSNIGFVTYGHTGEDVALYTYLPDNKRITGTIDNTDVAGFMATALGVDLDATTERLFFSESDLPTDIDVIRSEKALTLSKGKDRVILKRNKNIANVNGKDERLEGVVVFNDTKWYFPAEVLDFLE